MISIIVAMDKGRVIGVNGKLPWRLPADLKHFKSMTMGKPVIMGRKTYESIGRPLPGRRLIIISRQSKRLEGVELTNSFSAGLMAAAEEPETIIAGGASIYHRAMTVAARIYLTEVHTRCTGNTWFPKFDRTLWQERSRERFSNDKKNEYDYSFVLLVRR